MLLWTTVCVLMLLCVLILLCMCPHTTIFVSSWYCMCLHPTIYVSEYYYICVVMCPHHRRIAGRTTSNTCTHRRWSRRPETVVLTVLKTGSILCSDPWTKINNKHRSVICVYKMGNSPSQSLYVWSLLCMVTSLSICIMYDPSRGKGEGGRRGRVISDAPPDTKIHG